VSRVRSSRGFTLLEILLVVGAIAILAGIVILAINPGKQLADTRNAQRRVDVNTILNAIYQQAIDSNGGINGAIRSDTVANCLTVATNQICNASAGVPATCTGFTDLTSLTLAEKYLTAIPKDPTGATANSSDYSVVKSANGRITVCAPAAEQNAIISITR